MPVRPPPARRRALRPAAAGGGEGGVCPSLLVADRAPPAAPQLPNKKAKVAAWIIGVTALGVGIPCFAVVYQQNKLKG